MAYSADIVQAAEETKARTVTTDEDRSSDSPAYRSASYKKQIDDVMLMREVYGGTRSMRAGGEKYLPKHPMESNEKYARRKGNAVAFNAVRKTVSGLAGMIFRKDPQWDEGTPQRVIDHAENIDLKGNKLPVFLRDVAECALLDGHTWLHVEAPPTEGFRNSREAEQAGARPYWINVKKSQAINWRFEMRGGRPVLTLFVYREGHIEPDGEFGEQAVERIRVLREAPAESGQGRVIGELWEKRSDDNGKDKWVQMQRYRVDVTEIPVVPVYAERTAEYESRPPLLDLAYEQIEHYRVRSDRQRSMTFASIAVPYMFGEGVIDGEGNPQVTWGPDGMLLNNNPDTTAGVLESHGFGLEATKEELREIKENMAALGLRMIVRPAGVGPRTATEELINKGESDASLAAFSLALQDATNEALRIHASYGGRGLSADRPGSITLNSDFHEQLIPPQMVQVLSSMVSAGQMSLDTMWEILVDGELLPASFEPEMERERIQDEPAGDLEAFQRLMQGRETGEAA